MRHEVTDGRASYYSLAVDVRLLCRLPPFRAVGNLMVVLNTESDDIRIQVSPPLKDFPH